MEKARQRSERYDLTLVTERAREEGREEGEQRGREDGEKKGALTAALLLAETLTPELLDELRARNEPTLARRRLAEHLKQR